MSNDRAARFEEQRPTVIVFGMAAAFLDTDLLKAYIANTKLSHQSSDLATALHVVAVRELATRKDV